MVLVIKKNLQKICSSYFPNIEINADKVPSKSFALIDIVMKNGYHIIFPLPLSEKIYRMKVWVKHITFNKHFWMQNSKIS